MNVKNWPSEASNLMCLLNGACKFDVTDLAERALTPQILQSVSYLDSDEAVDSLHADPYWPKWNSPWWHMTLLCEMGLAEKIPDRALDAFQSVARKHYIDVFPLREEELPADCDPTRNIYCFCALATAMQIFEARGLRSDDVIPWARSWFARYQITDGGFNCAEEVYVRETPRSSIVSTVPMLEALLKLSDRGLSSAEEEILDRGIQYLLERRLFRSLSKKDQVIDPDFLVLTFPRFYEYDILRGLKLVTDWAIKRQKKLPWTAIEEAFAIVCGKVRVDEGSIAIERQFYAGKKTLARDDKGEWSRGHDVSVFPLLEAVGALGPSPFLHRQFMYMYENVYKLTYTGCIEL
ncbi:MAG: hypothetical protein K2Y39_21610 [Candidatus Obscuribacterales bacterium]|nr:hypothetical protein [Candidatus Obscuribacterales bacterium]